jgi:predicted DsbA family dithiol-disulfide isomerase
VPIEIPTYYDFASTICYVTHVVMRRQEGELAALGVELRWQPIDLARITGWPRGAAVEGERRDNALRVAAEFEVAARMPPRWLDSRAAHAAALALRGSAREPNWRERVWTAVFEEGRDIGEAGEMARLAADAGIDLAELDLEAVDTATRAAYEAGVSGVPTLDLGGWLLPGLQDTRTTRLLLERFLEKRSQR